MAHRNDTLADRINAEPPILRGCSSSELLILLVGGVMFWVPVGLILGSLMGAVFAALGIAGIGIIATVWLAATAFQRIKRGRPDGYYQQRVLVFLHDTHLYPSRFIRRSGLWDIGRTY